MKLIARPMMLAAMLMRPRMICRSWFVIKVVVYKKGLRAA